MRMCSGRFLSLKAVTKSFVDWREARSSGMNSTWISPPDLSLSTSTVIWSMACSTDNTHYSLQQCLAIPLLTNKTNKQQQYYWIVQTIRSTVCTQYQSGWQQQKDWGHTAFAFSSDLHAMIVWAPMTASCFTVSYPMPALPPVTTATFPERLTLGYDNLAPIFTRNALDSLGTSQIRMDMGTRRGISIWIVPRPRDFRE